MANTRSRSKEESSQASLDSDRLKKLEDGTRKIRAHLEGQMRASNQVNLTLREQTNSLEILVKGQERIQKQMEGVIRQMTTLTSGLTVLNASISEIKGYEIREGIDSNVPTLEFPIFEGTGAREWKATCINYFQSHPLDEAEKIPLTMLNFRNRAYTWSRGYLANHPNCSWEELSISVCKRFGESEERPLMEEFSQLKQKGEIDEHTDKFKKKDDVGSERKRPILHMSFEDCLQLPKNNHNLKKEIPQEIEKFDVSKVKKETNIKKIECSKMENEETTIVKKEVEVYSVEKCSTTEYGSIELQGHRSDVRSVTRSSDNTLLMTTSHRAIKIWDPGTCSCIMDSGYGLCELLVRGNEYDVGLQRCIISLDGPVVTLGRLKGELTVVKHYSPFLSSDEQMLEFRMFNICYAAQKFRGRLPLTPGSYPTWFGFSEEGQLSPFDSKGVLRIFTNQYGGSWLPLFRASKLKKAGGNYWVVGLNASNLFCSVCKSIWEKDSTSNFRVARLNLIYIAGFERQKTFGAEGELLKEAASINKSFSTLGRVIMVRVDVVKGRPRHIPYRDSILTFLLQDSLGENSKTIIIAIVSPSMCYAAETLNTLPIAQQAKLLQNNAIVNEDSSGDDVAVQNQIRLLKEKLSLLKRQNVFRSFSIGQEMTNEARQEGNNSSCGQTLENDHQGLLQRKESKGTLRLSMKQFKSLETTLTRALRWDQMAETFVKQLETETEQLNRLIRQRGKVLKLLTILLAPEDVKERQSRVETVVILHKRLVKRKNNPRMQWLIPWINMSKVDVIEKNNNFMSENYFKSSSLEDKTCFKEGELSCPQRKKKIIE